MLNNTIFYHGLTKKVIVAFGLLFSDIHVKRENKQKTKEQTLKIPISYAPKEKWLTRVDQDPNLTQNVYTALPQMSFEITGMSYDASRKLQRMGQLQCVDPLGTGVKTMFTPVPYNIDLSLYIITKTNEDMLQIVEQILPYFSPEYTLQIKSVPDMNIISDVPIILNGINMEDDYEGDFETRRFVTYTLNFTAKAYFYGPSDSNGFVKKVIVDMSGGAAAQYTAEGTVPGAPIDENWIDIG